SRPISEMLRKCRRSSYRRGRCRSRSSTVRMSRRASWAARSAPTPQSEVTGAASGEDLFSGGGIGRTIQTVPRGFNGKGAGAGSNFNHHDFGAAVEADRHGKPADAGRYVQRAGVRLIQAQVVLVHE